MIFRVYYKSIGSKESATPHIAYVKAEGKKDAKRIMEENLDTLNYYVDDVTEAVEHMVTPQSVTINFQNKSQYHYCSRRRRNFFIQCISFEITPTHPAAERPPSGN